MLFGRCDHKRANPYVALAVGALAFIGVLSIAQNARKIMRCGRDKVTCMVKDIVRGADTGCDC